MAEKVEHPESNGLKFLRDISASSPLLEKTSINTAKPL